MTLNELNYAPEIASSMLRKQTAQAQVDARQLIVKGSVEIAFGAVDELEKRGLKMNDQDKLKLHNLTPQLRSVGRVPKVHPSKQMDKV